MSQAPSSNNNNQQAQARAQAQQKQNEANQQQAKAFEKASTPTGNTGTGYGGGRITFDKSGNTLQDGKIVQFAGRQAQESYLADRGIGNNGVILDQAKAAKADFSNLQQANISGVVNAEQPIGGFGWNWGGNISGGRQITRGSSLEQQIEKSEADKAGKIYSNFENADYATGGKKDSDKTVVSLGKAESFFGKTPDNQYGWHDIGKDQLVRGSAKEEQVKQSEAEKAFTNPPSKSNASYITGGTPDKTFGGVQTKQSQGKNEGWAILAPDQLSRNSPKEEAVKASETSKASIFVKDTSKAGYDTGLGGLTDRNATSSTSSLAFLSRGKSLTPEEQQDKNNSILLGNGLASLSNQQIKQKNFSSDKEFRDYLHKGTDQGAVFSFFVGDKKVGETSGARSYHDFLEARQKFGNNISVGENFPSREKTLSDAVQKNTAFYSNLPQSYWTALSKEGYFSEKNQGKINEQISLYGKTQSREALASGQGILPAVRFGGVIPTDKGPKVIGPEQNEVASFMKFPFAGQKTSTSFLKSTSYSDILQFYPGVPGLGKAIAPASEAWINLIGRGQTKFGEIKTGLATNVRTSISGKVMEGAINYPKPKPEELSLESRVGRNEPTFRPTNPTRAKLPTNIISKDTAFGETPVSARQNNPRNTFFEDTSKDVQGSLTKSQNDLLKPRTPDTNPPASRNIPFFAGRKDTFGRLFTDNSPAIKTSTTPANESINVSGLTSGVSPIRTSTDTSTTGLSPTSSQFFGVQFQGSYPSSYLPPAAGQIGSSAARNVESDIFYRPARKSRNIELPFGENPRESVSANQGLISARKNLVKENQSIFLTKSQNDLLVPTKKEQLKIITEKAPEETNILGRRGKPPVKGSSPLDVTQTPRSEFVERGRVRAENEVFTNRGQKIKNEYGDVLFGELTKPQGALRSTPKGTKASKPVIDLEPQKEYQDWRFQKRSSEGPFNYGFRVGKPPKEVNLEERKDYQDWRFANFLKKNPQPEKTGESSSRLTDIFNAGQAREARERKLAKPRQASLDIVEGNTRNFFSSENKMFSETKINLGKGIGNLIPKSGGREAVTKTFKKPPPPSFTRTFEEPKGSTKEVGGGLLAILKEPKTVTKSPQILRKPKPSSTQIVSVSNIQKPRSSLNQIMSGYLKNLQKQRAKPEQTTKARQSQIFKPLQEQKNKPVQFGIFKPIQKQTQSSIFKPTQSPRQQPKPFSGFIQTPKQGTSPKQGQPQIFKPIYPTPQTPRQTIIQTPTYPPRNPPYTPPKHPPKLPPPVILFGPTGRKRGGKNKSGPTGLINLNVNNVFASSLNINVGKNRVEF